MFAAALVFTSCSDSSDSGGETPPASYTVTFSVDGANGTLTAQAEGKEATTNSPISVEYGKTVLFTAAPVGNYRIKEWRVDNVVVTGCTDNPYTRIVTKALDVKVSFEPLPPGTASYTVKHYQEQTDDSYPAEPTESEILHGTVGENAAYTPKTGGAYDGFTYNSALTKINGTQQENGTIADDGSTVVELYYERNTVSVSFNLAGGNVGGSTDDIVLSGKYGTTLTAPSNPVQAGFAFKGWDPELPDTLVFPAANAEYTAKWVALYNIDFGVKDDTGGTLTAQAEGEGATTNSPISVEYGKTVTFTAAPDPDYGVEKWTNGGTVIAEAGTDTNYSYTVTADADIKVKFQSLFVEGGASLILSPDKLDIRIKVITSDGSVTVEGCNEATLTSGTETVLHANGTRVILKGKITELYCYNNQLGALNVQGLSALKELRCYNNKLTALNVQGLSALKALNCHNNQLGALNVQGLSALQELHCNNNQLGALNVQGLSALQELYCWNNQLTALNVQGLSALKKLDCSGNKLTALNVQGLSALKELRCYNNKLTALDVQGLSALQALYCGSNQLGALNVQGLSALQVLDCSNNRLTALNVQGLSALKELYCNGNQLDALNVQGLSGLQELRCSDNQLGALNVRGCIALQGLDCCRNQLTALNVQGLSALQELGCSDNQLTALNVQGLSALKWLYCHNNRLGALNVQGCAALQELRCYNNRLDANAFEKIFDDLPARADSDNARCCLYTEQTGVTEGNHTDFSVPEALKNAFEKAKNVKKWKMYKINAGWGWQEI